MENLDKLSIFEGIVIGIYGNWLISLLDKITFSRVPVFLGVVLWYYQAVCLVFSFACLLLLVGFSVFRPDSTTRLFVALMSIGHIVGNWCILYFEEFTLKNIVFLLVGVFLFFTLYACELYRIRGKRTHSSEDPLKGWFGDLSIYDEAFEKTLELHQNEIKKCVVIRNGIICIEYLLMNERIVNNTLEEVKADFEASLFSATHGFYKYSMDALRSALEVCFEGLYYHFNPEKYNKWLQGKRKRVNVKSSFQTLRQNASSFDAYDSQFDLQKEAYDVLYKQLSHFVHTQGQRSLEIEKRGDIVPHYNSQAFDEWYLLYKKTFEVIATSFLVIFPQISASKDDCLKDIVSSLSKERLKRIMDISSP